MDKVLLVLNRQNTFSGIPAQDIAENLKRELVAKIPDEPAALLRSVNEGAPLVETQPDHRVSVEIKRLATSLVVEDAAEEAVVAKPAERATGLVGRLRTALRHG